MRARVDLGLLFVRRGLAVLVVLVVLVVLPVLVVLLVASPAQAEEKAADGPADTPRGPLFHPDGPGRLRGRLAAGALMDVLPRRVVESEQRQVPQVTGNARVGLPWGFSGDLRASAIVVTNQAELGIAWSRRFGDFAFALHEHMGVWYGYLGNTSFDATGWGILAQPGLSLGIPWGDIRFTLMGELIATLRQHVKLGDAQQQSRTKPTFSGTAVTFVVENMLRGGGIVYFGVGALRTAPDYQAWIALSDSTARLPYPRFLGGYAF